MPVAPPTALIDRIDNLAVRERLGTIHGLTRRARVIFQNRADVPNDYSVLDAALAVCPLAGSRLNTADFKSMLLVERSARIVGDDFTVDVDLVYEHILEGPNQALDFPTNATFYGKGGSSIIQKKTNFYYPDGDSTRPRRQIAVGHTFTPEDWKTIGQAPFQIDFTNSSSFVKPDEAPLAGVTTVPFTVIQGAEPQIPFPQANYHLSGYMSVADPWLVVWDYIACINDDVWLGRPAFTWICSEVKFEIINTEVGAGIGPYRYRFDFEWQYNIDTWNPTVSFLDRRTGKPPAKLEAANYSSNKDGILDSIVDKDAYYLVPEAIGATIVQVKKQVPSGIIQPAGYWQVPALRAVNFAVKLNAVSFV